VVAHSLPIAHNYHESGLFASDKPEVQMGTSDSCVQYDRNLDIDGFADVVAAFATVVSGPFVQQASHPVFFLLSQLVAVAIGDVNYQSYF
jgi:hypothetical protein